MKEHLTEVERLPACDFCGRAARYDGKTKRGPWAYMCEECFPILGVGLGLGKGQELRVKRSVGGGMKKLMDREWMRHAGFYPGVGAAFFVVYGEKRLDYTLVRLYRNRKGTYTVDFEGYPHLTRTTNSYEKAKSIFLGAYEMAQRDWGASEINWGSYQP